MTLNHLIRDELWMLRMAARPSEFINATVVNCVSEVIFNVTDSRSFTQDAQSMIGAALWDGHGLRVAD